MGKAQKTTVTKKILLKKGAMKSFPKVELHRHLEGTFNQNTLFHIAKKNNLETPSKISDFKKKFRFPKDSGPDFLRFLSMFKNDWYRSFDDVQNIVYSSVKNFTQDNLFYIELRFSPEHFSLHNNFDRGEITSLVMDAADQAAQEENFHIRYLLTFNRHMQTAEEMDNLLGYLKKKDLSRVVGIDLAGDEENYPPEQFKSFFEKIHREGRFRSTIHAGEVTDSQQIWYAVDQLKADRIGHGTSAIHDSEIQKHLKAKDIALEQCITSNFQTGSWPDIKNHPLGRLHRAGVPVTINSDDPSIQNSDLTDDYMKAVKYFDFGYSDLRDVNLTALQHSFLPEKEREDLEKAYRKKLSTWLDSVSRET